MPEGDTVWRTADRLNRALAGVPLTRLELRWGELGGLDLLPATTLAVTSRGKHLLHDLDTGVTLHTHLRMEGSYRLRPATEMTASARANPQLRVLAETAEWAVLGLRLGLVELWPSSESAQRLAYLGPDILGPTWDIERAVTSVKADPGRPIGDALLDQRNLAGIGTFWASEGLFIRRISPWSPTSALPVEDISGLLDRIANLMTRAAATGIQSSTGRDGRDEEAFAHARSGRPCRRCNDTIRVAGIGPAPRTRTMFYCPTCQGGLAPTDDGRRQRPLGASGGRRSTYRRPGSPR